MQGREAAYALKNWNRLPEWIIKSVDRLKQVQIECKPALEVITRHNHSNVLIYADPPYLLETRTAKQYANEMSDDDHAELLQVLMKHKGPVALSGYDSKLYNDMLRGWRKTSIISNAEYYNGSSKVECLWMNYEAAEQQLKLF